VAETYVQTRSVTKNSKLRRTRSWDGDDRGIATQVREDVETGCMCDLGRLNE
jgi:hypothetical protein